MDNLSDRQWEYVDKTYTCLQEIFSVVQDTDK